MVHARATDTGLRSVGSREYCKQEIVLSGMLSPILVAGAYLDIVDVAMLSVGVLIGNLGPRSSACFWYMF